MPHLTSDSDISSSSDDERPLQEHSPSQSQRQSQPQKQSQTQSDEEEPYILASPATTMPPNDRTSMGSSSDTTNSIERRPTKDTEQHPLLSTTPLGDWRVILNVGGRRFETYARTFAKYPTTLLATIFLERNLPLLKPDEKGEYFFDRNGDAFAAILDFYRTGILVPPPSIPMKILKKEIDFFQLPKDCLYLTPGERFTAMALAAARKQNEAEIELIFQQVYAGCNKAIEACCGTVKIDFLRNASYMRTTSGRDSCQGWQWNVNVIDKNIVKFLSDKANAALFSNVMRSKGFSFELYPLSRASFGLQIALWDETKKLLS
eukprot:TRINITY_DN365_c0_g5_i1.p1 TRINITY_DN365_c0_g5~~TRINITY_DN365_c0_g5_i1.p1  ORF type:complete len:342 (-),score=72.04 TRINITY_DN365_c0_g5_i1:77-1033(-)